eukprot:CAMPEP_0175082688 /NCGR_PEP_ID=MMETSP0052_2-20121109/26902_1 /TAXON_ID=51329 ORGANISM="Polytomella parva, Strain SAG 63-3" /NCGR_SAMPLE_ID=MMETSP0052_2 /ASSEMBLY_ACC=CAM_ASM_000194 /LENGTH=514 /DNA_ID=CAMNT_0016353927 /DNA_START=36 /DNA_END=1577 /DNA_ORIENTATION=-
MDRYIFTASELPSPLLPSPFLQPSSPSTAVSSNDINTNDSIASIASSDVGTRCSQVSPETHSEALRNNAWNDIVISTNSTVSTIIPAIISVKNLNAATLVALNIPNDNKANNTTASSAFVTAITPITNATCHANSAIAMLSTAATATTNSTTNDLTITTDTNSYRWDPEEASVMRSRTCAAPLKEASPHISHTSEMNLRKAGEGSLTRSTGISDPFHNSSHDSMIIVCPSDISHSNGELGSNSSRITSPPHGMMSTASSVATCTTAGLSRYSSTASSSSISTSSAHSMISSSSISTPPRHHLGRHVDSLSHLTMTMTNKMSHSSKKMPNNNIYSDHMHLLSEDSFDINDHAVAMATETSLGSSLGVTKGRPGQTLLRDDYFAASLRGNGGGDDDSFLTGKTAVSWSSAGSHNHLSYGTSPAVGTIKFHFAVHSHEGVPSSTCLGGCIAEVIASPSSSAGGSLPLPSSLSSRLKQQQSQQQQQRQQRQLTLMPEKVNRGERGGGGGGGGGGERGW